MKLTPTTPRASLRANARAKALYLDWRNNFLTLARFAEYYGITERSATKIIEAGRLLNEE